MEYHIGQNVNNLRPLRRRPFVQFPLDKLDKPGFLLLTAPKHTVIARTSTLSQHNQSLLCLCVLLNKAEVDALQVAFQGVVVKVVAKVFDAYQCCLVAFIRHLFELAQVINETLVIS